jgi:hypothetical protein
MPPSDVKLIHHYVRTAYGPSPLSVDPSLKDEQDEPAEWERA